MNWRSATTTRCQIDKCGPTTRWSGRTNIAAAQYAQRGPVQTAARAWPLNSVVSSMRATVERAGQADLPGLLELMNQFYAESNYELDGPWAEESFRQLLGNEALGAVWVVREGAEMLGYVVLTFRHSMEFGGLVGYIDDLFVRANFRRKGAGSALLTVLLQTCRSLELGAVHVEVGSTNHAASALYRAFGLEPISDDRQILMARLNMVSGPRPRGEHNDGYKGIQS